MNFIDYILWLLKEINENYSQMFLLLVSMVTTFLVWRIGNKQNEINKRSLEVNDFAELFLMPQSIVNDQKVITGWNLLIQNFSSYPAYLSSYTLNGIKTEVGNSPIPNNPANWYYISIPPSIQTEGKFSITIIFEDHCDRRYQVDGAGLFNGNWSVHSKRRIELD